MDIKQQLKVQIRVKWSIERSNAVVPWLCNTANSGPSLGSLRPSYHSSSWGWSCALCTANPSQHLTVWVFHVSMRDNFISSPPSHLAVLSLPLPLILLQRLCHSWAPSCFLRYRRRSTSLPRYLTSSLYAETLGDIYVRLHSSSIYHLGRKCMNDIVSHCRGSMAVTSLQPANGSDIATVPQSPPWEITGGCQPTTDLHKRHHCCIHSKNPFYPY